MKKLLYVIVLFLMFIPNVFAKEDSIVNIYLFHSYSCPHCKKEIKLLDELEKKYDNIKVYKFELSENNNGNLLGEITRLLDARVGGTPFTIIGEKYFNGFSEENTKRVFSGAIEYYSKYGYKDVVGEYLNENKILEVEIPTFKEKTDITIDEYIDEYGNYTFNLPLLGNINTKNLTLPLIAVVIGLIDGFNPCAMWVLLFLISMLIGINDKKKMLILGFSFLFTSALVYFLLMLVWLDASSVLVNVNWIRNTIGLVAVIGGIYNLITEFKEKEEGCNVVNDKKRNKIFDKIKKFTKEKNLFLALIGVITLAISVNIIELACSAGLPLVFTSILSMNNLPKTIELIYLLIYILFFLLDDIIVFTIAMITLKLTGISTKYGKISKIIGGFILVIMGILLIFFPNIVMLNF